MANRDELIAGLAAEFNKGTDMDLVLDAKNYIAETGSLDCTISALSEDTIQKTLNVIKQHENKFMKDAMKNKQAMQYVYHLRVAKRCLEEILSQKRKGLI